MTFHAIARDPVSAHKAIVEAFTSFAKPHTMAGNPVEIIVRKAEDDRTVHQNRYYWGVILKAISEQARIGGQKYTADAWHEMFKREYLPRKVKKTTVAGRRKKVVSVSIGSTAGLSVRAMSVYLEKVQAFAATELGVTFPEKAAPHIDPETGEILGDD